MMRKLFGAQDEQGPHGTSVACQLQMTKSASVRFEKRYFTPRVAPRNDNGQPRGVGQGTHLAPTQFSALTTNINGLLTKTQRGTTGNKVTKTTIVAKYVHSSCLDFVGIQELHLSNTHANFHSASKIFNDRHFDLISNLSDDGRGGAAIAVHQRWTIVDCFALDVRILCALCRNIEEHTVLVVSAHFHINPPALERQWNHLHSVLSSMDGVPIMVLADYNSWIHPALDCAQAPKTETQDVLTATTAVRALEALELTDAWRHVHFDRESQSMPKGFTWPAYINDKDKDQTASLLRRLDRIHVLMHMVDAASAVHVAFLGRSDHKAAVLKVHSPIFNPRPPRRKCPLQLLQDKQLVADIELELDQGGGEATPRPLQV